MDNYFAFDFDGVICDSARETAHTAWRAARGLWPDRVTGEPGEEYLARFARLRPVIETGYENLLVVALVAGGTPDRVILDDFHGLCEELIAREKLDRADLRRRFGEARDAWRESDMASWLEAQGFFPGVVDAVNALEAPRCIITTKEARFTRTLVEHAGLDVPADRIYPLEAFESDGKGSVLEALAHEYPKARIHFFEDRFRTLDGLRHLPRTHLYLVDWGYNTGPERERAAADPDIELLDMAGFEAVLAGRART